MKNERWGQGEEKKGVGVDYGDPLGCSGKKKKRRRRRKKSVRPLLIHRQVKLSQKEQEVTVNPADAQSY